MKTLRLTFVRRIGGQTYNLGQAVDNATKIVTELDPSHNYQHWHTYFARKFIFGWDAANFTLRLTDKQFEHMRLLKASRRPCFHYTELSSE